MAMDLNAALKITTQVDGANKIVDLNRALMGVEGTTKNVTGAMKSMVGATAGLAGVLGTLTPLLSVVGLVAMAKGAIDAGQEMLHLSEKTGISVEELARFKKAAALANIDIETVAGSVVKLSKQMLEASIGNKASAATFEVLGISVKNANGTLRNSGDVLIDIANKFKAMPDGAEKTALALRFFGRAGAEMIPLLDMGGDAIQRLGTKMTTAFAEKANQYKQDLSALSGAASVLGIELGSALLPAITAFTELVTQGVRGLTGMIDGFGAAYQKSKEFKAGIDQVVGALTLLAATSALASFIATLPVAIAGVMRLITALKELRAVEIIVELANPVGLLAGGVTALAVGLDKYLNQGKATQWLGEQVTGGMKALMNFGTPKPEMPDVKLPAPNLAGLNTGKLNTAAVDKAAQLQIDIQSVKNQYTYVVQQSQINDLLDKAAQLKSRSMFTAATANELQRVDKEQSLEILKINDQRTAAIQKANLETDKGTAALEVQKINLDSNLKIIEARTKAERERQNIIRQSTIDTINQTDAIKKSVEAIKYANYYSVVGATRGSNEAQRQKELKDLQDKINLNQQLDKAAGIASSRQTQQAQLEYDATVKKFKELEALGNNVNYGLAKGAQAYLDSVGSLADRIGNAVQGTLKGLEDALVNFVKTGKLNFLDLANYAVEQLARIIIQQTIIGPLAKGLGSLFNPASAVAAPAFAANGMVAVNGIQPFAMGGIVGNPTLFRFANGGAMQNGLMGEAGPEAIIPLKRGADGRLGVSGGGGGTTVNVSVDAKGTNIQGNGGQSAALGRAIAASVQAELIKQKRPGGLLAA